ncbi:hypothetical protein FACS189464_0940 [Bacteroidia bacterium]|nr:hypothetical protein FACS189464_0940 [Bacteroidia bacterium]
MKVSKLIILISLFVASCSEKKDERIISINDYSNEFEFSTIVSDIKVITLQTDGDLPLGRITDLCFIGDTIYVLDETTASVFMFSKIDGKMLKVISQRGPGPNDYSSPAAIDSYLENIWLLDRAQKMICYDRES